MRLPAAASDADTLSPLQLAFVGDAVYGLMVRTHLLEADRKVRSLHQDATGRVNAAAQSDALSHIAPILTESEADLVRRSRNVHAKHPAPRSATSADYTASTALEALFGYLYVSGQENRLRSLFDIICARQQEEHHAGNCAQG